MLGEARQCYGKADSEPIVCDTAPVSWQVFKAVKPVEMVNRNLRHHRRFSQAQVNRNAPPPFFIRLQ